MKNLLKTCIKMISSEDKLAHFKLRGNVIYTVSGCWGSVLCASCCSVPFCCDNTENVLPVGLIKVNHIVWSMCALSAPWLCVFFGALSERYICGIMWIQWQILWATCQVGLSCCRNQVVRPPAYWLLRSPNHSTHTHTQETIGKKLDNDDPSTMST